MPWARNIQLSAPVCMFVSWAALGQSCTVGSAGNSAALRYSNTSCLPQANSKPLCQWRRSPRLHSRRPLHTAARPPTYAEDLETAQDDIWSDEEYAADAPRNGQPGSGESAGPSNRYEEHAEPQRINERDPRRKSYHRRLHQAARDGQPAEVAVVLEEMQEQGLQPGPRAFHSLIVANAQAGQAQEALDSLRAAWGQGMQPIPESYCAVISIFVGGGDMDTGKAVFNSMQRAGHDARPGWLAFVKACFRWGAHAPTWRAILWGLEQGLTPDADLFELFIHALALMPRRHPWATQILKYDMRALGVPPETRHANALIRGVAVSRYPHEANKALAIILGGCLGADCRPNMDTYNAVLEGVVHHKRLGTGLSEGSPCGPTASLIQAEALIMGCRPNKLTHALYCELAMLNRREDEAASRWNSMCQVAAPGAATQLIDEETLFQLIQLNLFCRKPWHLLPILQALVSDGRPLPPAAFNEVLPGSDTSQLTSWLDWRLAEERMQRHIPGKMQPAECREAIPQMYDVSLDWKLHEEGSLPEEQLFSTQMVDPLLRCVCLDNGTPMAASRMDPTQHRTELGLKGRLVEGQDLYRAVLDSRLGTRPPLEVEVRRQEIELLARDTSGFTDEEASSGRRIRASKVGGASAVEVVETRADVTIGGRVYDAASDPDGDPDIDPFDDKDRAGLAVERYMLRKALREQNGGKDPGQDQLEEYHPEPHWQSPLPTAQLAWQLVQLASLCDASITAEDWLYVARAAWLTRCSETAYQLGNGLCTADYVELGMVFEPAVQMCIATLETEGHEEHAQDLRQRYAEAVTGSAAVVHAAEDAVQAALKVAIDEGMAEAGIDPDPEQAYELEVGLELFDAAEEEEAESEGTAEDGDEAGQEHERSASDEAPAEGQNGAEGSNGVSSHAAEREDDAGVGAYSASELSGAGNGNGHGNGSLGVPHGRNGHDGNGALSASHVQSANGRPNQTAVGAQ